MKKCISLILTIVMVLSVVPFYAVTATAEGENQTEPTFSISVSGNTFTVSRSSGWKQQTVAYKTVSGTAVEGIHFTRASGTLTFGINETSKTVTVTETAVGNIPIRYRYQSGNYREYYLEVFDSYGFLLASGKRLINYGSAYQFNNAHVNTIVDTLMRDNGTGLISNYVDVRCGSSTDYSEVNDGGYNGNNQVAPKVHNISTESLFLQSGCAPREYLSAIGDKIYAAARFEIKEKNDGYQYIQILADNDTTCDSDDNDGTVSQPSISLYKAAFERDADSDTANSESCFFVFPHKYDYKNRAEEDAAGIPESTFFSSPDNKMYVQKYRNDTVKASPSGALCLDPTVENLNVRFDASGSGSDTWYFRNLQARFTLCDDTAPYPMDAFYVSTAPNCIKHSPVTITICFNEIVYPYNCVLKTTWGDLPVISSTGYSNVLSFRGPITANAGTALKITGIEGAVMDLCNRTMTATISKNLSYTVGQSPTLNSSNGVYLISNAAELYAYADMLESYPNRSGKLTADIDMSNSSVAGFKAMAGTSGFTGTFDGDGYKIMNLQNVSAVSNGLCGLFGYVSAGGCVRNLYLDITFTAPLGSNGGICGLNLGTVENCIVSGEISNSIADASQSTSSNRIGGVVGDNRGYVRHCLALNEIYNKWDNPRVGGIVGYNSYMIDSCCFYGKFSSRATVTRGAVCGENASNGTITNCAARILNSNYYSYAIGSDSGTTTNTLFMSASDFASGKACYEVLNNRVCDGSQFWYQNINNGQTPDECPQLTGATVYKHGNTYTNYNGHVLSYDAGIPAGCETQGQAGHWVCTVDGCGKIFSDENGQNETTLSALVIPALGHDWHTCWIADSTTHWHACNRCDEITDTQMHSLGDASSWSWLGLFKAHTTLTCSVCECGFSYTADVTYTESVDSLTATATVNACGKTFTDEKTAPLLALGENHPEIVEDNDREYYFIPSVDGMYSFYSDIYGCNPEITIFDSDYDTIGSDDNSGPSANFSCNCMLEAGKLYLIVLSSSYESCNITMYIVHRNLYTLSSDSSVQHGSVYASKYHGAPITQEYDGNTVYVKAIPEAGYVLKSVTVSDTDGNTISTKNQFTMPDKNVTVSAEFAPYEKAPLHTGENTVYVDYVNTQNYTFTPSHDGLYRFYSVGDYDPSIYLDKGSVSIGNNSDSGEGLNFDLTATLEAGTTYTVTINSMNTTGHYTGLMTMYICSEYDVNGDGAENIGDIEFIISASEGNTAMNETQEDMADIDRDGVVDGFDAAELDRILYGYTNPKGDVNQDGIVNSLDYAMLKSYVLCDNVDLLNKNYLDSEYDSIKDDYTNGTIITQRYYCADFNSDKSVDAFDVYYLDSRIYTIV